MTQDFRKFVDWQIVCAVWGNPPPPKEEREAIFIAESAEFVASYANTAKEIIELNMVDKLITLWKREGLNRKEAVVKLRQSFPYANDHYTHSLGIEIDFRPLGKHINDVFEKHYR